MFRCRIRANKYRLKNRVVYIPACNGEVKRTKINNKEVYVCKECRAIFAIHYIEIKRYKIKYLETKR